MRASRKSLPREVRDRRDRCRDRLREMRQVSFDPLLPDTGSALDESDGPQPRPDPNVKGRQFIAGGRVVFLGDDDSLGELFVPGMQELPGEARPYFWDDPRERQLEIE